MSELVEPPISQRVLVVEDLEDARTSLCELLEMALGLKVDAAEDGAKALELLGKNTYSLVITDLQMPKIGGMKLLEQIQAKRIPVTVIVTTGHGSIKDAVAAMQFGAYDFLTKPADPDHLCLLVKRALKNRELQDEVASLRMQLQQRHSFIYVGLKHITHETRWSRVNGEMFRADGHAAWAITRSNAIRTGVPFEM